MKKTLVLAAVLLSLLSSSPLGLSSVDNNSAIQRFNHGAEY